MVQEKKATEMSKANLRSKQAFARQAQPLFENAHAQPFGT